MDPMSGKPAPSSLENGHGTSSTSAVHDLLTMLSPEDQGSRNFRPNASLVLVGIRGSGKRSLGFIAATALNWRFITEDHYFKEIIGCSRSEFLQKAGRREFHRKDVEVLKLMLDNHRTKCVIECGLGSLTQSFQQYLQQYARTNPVVYLLRDMDQIQRLLNLEDSAVQLLQSTDPSHRNGSNLEFYNLEDHSSDSHGQDDASDRRCASYSFKLKEVKEDFTHFVRFVTGVGIALSGFDSEPFSLLEDKIESSLHTHAIFVRLSNLLDGLVDLCELDSGGEAVEFCVDVWPSDAARVMSKYVSMLRRSVGVPIIFSVDIRALQISKRSLPLPFEEIYFKTLSHGLRLGVEYLSLDLTQSDIADNPATSQLLQFKGRTKIIGHFFLDYSHGLPWETEDCMRLYKKAELLGCDVVRILQVAKHRLDNDAVCALRAKVRSLPGNHPPLIAYNVGILGRTSQVFNQILTSVTHSAIKKKRDVDGYDPLITSRDAVRALFQSFVPDPLQFYVIGTNVTYSLSPAMHNAAFHEYGMAHTYRIPERTSLAELDRLAMDPNFGGASILQPWRVKVFELVAAKSRHAEAIGAVNTVMPLRADATGYIYPLKEQASLRNRAGRVAGWYGDNTDWISVFVCLRRSLSPRNAISSKSTGLVIGAGGLARAAIYAMLNLGCRSIFIYNRTVENAETVARHFNSWASSSSESGQVVRVLPSSKTLWPSGFAFPCMIVSCVPANTVGGDSPTALELSEQWLGSPTGGVVLEMAYNPINTDLLKKMRRYLNEAKKPWVLVDGLEVVAEQGIAQFELLTGRRAPRRLMRREVLRNYVGEEGRYDEKTINARLRGISRVGY
uniref:Quinate repressor n=1 Tax=Coccidioides posadasii RMSCC 3488 TaxID=454284 RepID=A0A0J6F4J6_COCPO|nr:quinate repressor [Coccidioides posadasii RMSCC 3488]